jgi:Ni/Fe-hydrogenase subunit HybB-like protein
MMEGLFHTMPYTGLIYPNETVLPWSVMIVIYPYLTGLVAGAFTVSSFYHVFGMQRFKPVARFALLTALCFMVVVPVSLLLHLGHPERAFNPMVTPHWSSAFVAFGYFATAYVILLILEIWFAFREDVLWSDEVSERSRRFDEKWLFILAVAGIPFAHGLHGYVGFVFGSLKAREWWGSDLMPVIFLFSAVISGVAILIVLYIATCKIRQTRIDETCVRGLGLALWGFLMFTLLLEGVEFANVVYKAKEGVDMIMEYVDGPLFYRFFVFQFGIGSVLPILILTVMAFHHTRGRPLVLGTFISAALVLMSVFLMRWNVVIGGQEISKTMKGFAAYHPPFLGQEGLLMATVVLVLPFVLLWLVTRVLVPWEPDDASSAAEESPPLVAEESPPPVAAK